MFPGLEYCVPEFGVQGIKVLVMGNRLRDESLVIGSWALVIGHSVPKVPDRQELGISHFAVG
jgi:hypothetical protein